MFGFSFGEFVMICVVALVFVGPQKLPGLLRTLGLWIRKARSMVYDMRAQSGIDDILRAEGIHGGLSEVRSLLRGPNSPLSALADVSGDSGSSSTPHVAPPPSPYAVDPSFGSIETDPTREYPPEGPDSYGALPDDLIDTGEELAPTPASLSAAEPAPAEAQPESARAAAEARPEPAPVPPQTQPEPAPSPEGDAAPATAPPFTS